MAEGYEGLLVWQKAHAFVLDIYRVTADFPKEETYGLVSQLRRASVSIPTNIVEGKNRGGDGDYARFVYISRASCGEVEYLLLLAKDLGFLPSPVFEKLNGEVRTIGKMLNGLLKSLDNAPARSLKAGGRGLGAGGKDRKERD